MKRRFLAVILAVAMGLCVLPATAQADTLEGLFAGKFRAGSQIFDCQRGPVSDGVWRASHLKAPYARDSGQFTDAELANRYFAFKDTGRTTTKGGDTVPIVGLYLYNSDTGSPVHISEKTDADGFVNEGTIPIVADEGIIYIGYGGIWGYLISNAAGYGYGDFSTEYLYLRENRVENPTLEELKEFNASDIPLAAGEILLRFYANGENVTDMPDPHYRTKTVDVDFTIGGELSPSRGGYTFTGWNRNDDGSGVTYLPGAVYRSNVGLNLYAQWLESTGSPQQDAPTGVGKINASTWGGNGALTETTAAMQYRTADDANTWYWCVDSSTPVLAGEYWVRYAPKEGQDASMEAYVGKVLEPAQDAQAPSGLAAIDATVYGGNGAINGTDETMEYSADGTMWTTCSDPSTAVPAGVYSVRYKETADYAHSPAAQITITQPAEIPTITFVTQPAASTQVTAGKISGSLLATATVTPDGTATLNWYACNSGGTISGDSLGTGETFAIPSTLTAGNYYYCCQATFAGATTVNSNVAAVTVSAGTPPKPDAPTITSSTQDQIITVAVGNTATMTITTANATGYQWYIDRNDGRGFVAISGATSASYTTAPVAMENDRYRYYCAAPNGTPIAISPIFKLNVIKQPGIPATGDKPGPWIGLVLLAGAGLAVSVVLRHGKRA